jgi:xanthine/uracil/vitamin C permease (AzgA family)
MPKVDLNAPVRPLLAFMFGLTICLMFWYGKVSGEAFFGIASLVIGWFFKAREDEKKEAQIKERVTDQIKAIMAPPPAPPEAGK